MAELGLCNEMDVHPRSKLLPISVEIIVFKKAEAGMEKEGRVLGPSSLVL